MDATITAAIGTVCTGLGVAAKYAFDYLRGMKKDAAKQQQVAVNNALEQERISGKLLAEWHIQISKEQGELRDSLRRENIFLIKRVELLEAKCEGHEKRIAELTVREMELKHTNREQADQIEELQNENGRLRNHLKEMPGYVETKF